MRAGGETVRFRARPRFALELCLALGAFVCPTRFGALLAGIESAGPYTVGLCALAVAAGRVTRFRV